MSTPLLSTWKRLRVDEAALVLAAEGVRASVVQSADGAFELHVEDADAPRAEKLLRLYVAENPTPRHSEPTPHMAGAFEAAFATMSASLFFFLATGPRDPSVDWFERGSADATRILAGELWRTVTALTLHADLGHALGNAFAGTLFLTALGRSLGPGIGLALAIAAGASGNLLNAMLHGTAHSAVGASTAVFGTVGLLGGVGVVRRSRFGIHGPRRFAPLAAGLGLLAMLGTGPRVDLGAHVLGLLAGGALGVAAARLLPRPPRPAAQWAAAATAVLAIFYSWGLALT